VKEGGGRGEGGRRDIGEGGRRRREGGKREGARGDGDFSGYFKCGKADDRAVVMTRVEQVRGRSDIGGREGRGRGVRCDGDFSGYFKCGKADDRAVVFRMTRVTPGLHLHTLIGPSPFGWVHVAESPPQPYRAWLASWGGLVGGREWGEGEGRGEGRGERVEQVRRRGGGRREGDNAEEGEQG
jgi:hypothetical protein